MGIKSPSLSVSFELSLVVVEFADVLENHMKFEIAKQLTKSATSVAANLREAQNAESIADFLHKIKVSAKEAEETEFWLDLCKTSVILPTPPQTAHDLTKSIQKILSKIIVTTKRRIDHNNKGKEKN